MVRRRVRVLQLSQLNVSREVEIPAKESRLDGRAYPLREDSTLKDTNGGPPSTCFLTAAIAGSHESNEDAVAACARVLHAAAGKGV